MTLNLDDYDEYVFHLPTWGRLKRKSPRPEDDRTPGEWHVLADLVAHKGRDPEQDPDATVGYITICNEHGYLHQRARVPAPGGDRTTHRVADGRLLVPALPAAEQANGAPAAVTRGRAR